MIGFNHFILLILLCVIAGSHAIGQIEPSDDSAKPVITNKMLDQLDKKTDFVNRSIKKQTTRYLTKMVREEEKLKKKLMKVDSSEAINLFRGTAQKYAALENKIKNISSADPGSLKGDYIPSLDSIKGAFRFLDNNKDFLEAGSGISDKLNDINRLQNSLQQAGEVSVFLKERKKQIGDVLKKYNKLPKGLSNDYSKYSKRTYYYSAQVKEYRELLKNPSDIEQKALGLLQNVPAFSAFMQKNSFLSGVFSVPANYGTPEALNGLQTRVQVQELIGTRLDASGPNAQSIIQQNMQAAQSQLNALKEKVNELGGGSSNMELPDFKPNTQKTKTFLERLEYGTNLQTVKSNYYYPTTTDISLNVGYKPSDKTVVGIGTSYKLGLGRDIKHISFSHQGVGFRSYFEYKMHKNFWATGGAEMNYRSAFKDIEVLKDFSAWQQSALMGVARKFQVSKKVKGNAQLLYDALWKSQVPRTQAIVFRIGYNF